MRNALFASTIVVVGYVMMSSASCSSSSTPSGGGSGGSDGAGGSAGAGGSGGSGGAGGDSGAISPTDPKLTALGFTSACNMCIASNCGSEFTACEAVSGCATAITCVAKCYLSTGNLETCAEETCSPDAGGTDSGVETLGHNVVLCIAGDCGTSATCEVTK